MRFLYGLGVTLILLIATIVTMPQADPFIVVTVFGGMTNALVRANE